MSAARTGITGLIAQRVLIASVGALLSASCDGSTHDDPDVLVDATVAVDAAAPGQSDLADASATPDGARDLSTHAGYAGLYVYIDPTVTAASNATLYADYVTALQDHSIDGVLLLFTWASIEATAGTYDWTTLDAWIGLAVQNDKHVSLGINAGFNSPTWLYAAPYNVPTHQFTYNNDPAGAAKCVTERIPSPWVSSFVTRYNQVMSALAAHLRANAEAYAPCAS